MTKNERNKSKQICFRPTDATERKLNKLVDQTGQTRSQIINELIEGRNTIKIVDGSAISKSLLELQVALKKQDHGPVIEKEVKDLCSEIIHQLYKLVGGEREAVADEEDNLDDSEEDKDGDSKSG